jgi:AcrR family transcriptional regulator
MNKEADSADRRSNRSMIPDRQPPRTRKGRETREILLRAAREIFERDGFTSARISDMTALAELSYGSFYNYFDSKDEIFWAVLARVGRDMLTGYQPETGPLDDGDLIEHLLWKIERSNADFIESFRKNAGMIRAMEEVATYSDDFRRTRRAARVSFIDRIARAIRRLQEVGAADRDLNPEYSAHALGAMMDRFCYAWFVLGDEFDHDLALQTLNKLWFNALGIDRSHRPKESVAPLDLLRKDTK